ncbi:ThiF family adenylyltransferase [Methylicorpusculum sp.]|uniref:ThiF family adenylyltransferase n=1 Tax=Methylicorpusculum sp. TaxID=2713644 RepID=UPI00273031AB|nr:ThiF family adenylyltransferase [Methylicorpusculum sp.]MDP2179642.1 ThiF family adenylyltransferase [Methylicorpusculum sp.]MDP3528917.1 ThiF family adenylyltransferase [Methylicorpusculum sp.]MDZ4153672.1 ThiF family adenylyltransferase [Methylicorpusculum sp.]
MPLFDYDLAFSRNHGITSAEQQIGLKHSTVAIAGMGGVGGDYLITLARIGVGNFKISDFDNFEMANFNRQYGATMSTIDLPKMEVMYKLALDINPEAKIQTFGSGIDSTNIDEFLEGVDVVVDAIEFFEINAHRILVNACMAKSIPVIFGVPLGYGVGMLVYTSDGMSFDDYFDLDYAAPLEQQVLKMSLGCAPAGFHLKYVDPTSVDLSQRKAPSIASGCKLATGMVITQTIMALLHPKELKPIPHYTCYDARLNKLKKGYLWRGNRHPLQKLKFIFARKMLGI